MLFCGNVVEYVEKYKVDEEDDFVLWQEADEELPNDIYVEQKVLDEYDPEGTILVDVVVFQEHRGMLFIKDS